MRDHRARPGRRLPPRDRCDLTNHRRNTWLTTTRHWTSGGSPAARDDPGTGRTGITPTISQIALRRLIHNLAPTGGSHHLFTLASPEDVGQLRNAGLTCIDLGGEVLIEDDDLVLLVGKSLWTPGEVTDIGVQAVIGASQIGSIPPFLVNLAHGLRGVARRPHHLPPLTSPRLPSQPVRPGDQWPPSRSPRPTRTMITRHWPSRVWPFHVVGDNLLLEC